MLHVILLTMQFNEYQEKAKKTDTYKVKSDRLQYSVLGLVGEAGEVADKVKKIMREEKGRVGEERRQELKQELGDVLWYMAKLARELGLKFDEIAKANIEKLYRRQVHGIFSGGPDLLHQFLSR